MRWNHDGVAFLWRENLKGFRPYYCQELALLASGEGAHAQTEPTLGVLFCVF